MKITLFTHKFPKISETFILNQVFGLYDRNQEVSIFSESKPDTPPKHDLIEKHNVRRRTTYTGNPETYIGGVRLLVKTFPKLIMNNRVSISTFYSEFRTGQSAPRRLSNLSTVTDSPPSDIYHAHFGTVGNSFLGVTKCYEAPYVVSFYGQDASRMLREDPNRYDELFEQADAVTALSKDMRTTLEDAGCPSSKTHIQPLCIDTSRFSFRPRSLEDSKSVELLTVARLVEKKGIEYAIRAIADLTDFYDITYRIAGDGPQREKIESLVRELELDDSIELLGWQSQSEVATLMNDAHLFVLPSVTAESGDKEGTPTVLLEAQSRGLPVVSTYHAGIPKIVNDSESGILVPERDSEALSDALEDLITSPDKWEEMGERGREHIEHNHSIEVVSDQLLELYRSLV